MHNEQVQTEDKTTQNLDHSTTQEVKTLLYDLEQLHSNGIVSDDEFESGKSKLLESL